MSAAPTQLLLDLQVRVQIMSMLYNANASATDTSDLSAFSRQLSDAVAKMATLQIGEDDAFKKKLVTLSENLPAVTAFCSAWQKFKATLQSTTNRRPSAGEKEGVLKRLREAIVACQGDPSSSTRRAALYTAVESLRSSSSGLYKFFPDAAAPLSTLQVFKSAGRQHLSSWARHEDTNSTRYYDPSTTRTVLEGIREAVEANTDLLPMDPLKATWGEFLKTVYAADAGDVGEYVGVPALYTLLGPALTASLLKAAADIGKMRDAVPARQSSDWAKLAHEMGELVKDVNALAAVMTATVDYTKLNFTTTSAKVANRVSTMLVTYAALLPRDGKDAGAWLKPGGGAGSGFGSVSRGFRGAGSAYESEGLLYRAPDVQRMATYVETLAHFVKSLASASAVSTITRISARVTGTVKDLAVKMGTLVDREMQTASMQRDALVNQKFIILRSYIDNVHGAVSRYRRLHGAFALNHNRSALRYMSYWRGIGPKGDAEALIKQYFEHIRAVLESAKGDFTGFQTQTRAVFFDGATMQSLNDKQSIELDELREGLADFIDAQADRVQGYHTVVDPSLLELVDDPQVIVLYVLKLLRFGLACLAVSIASRAFLAIYTDRVYTRQQQAPSPLLFLAMVLGIELAMGVAVFGVLWGLKSMFAGTGEFPIDDYLIGCWATDYALSTCAIALLGVGLAQIIASKKYFRYMYEGDRAIRALAIVLRYEYGVFLAMPFFRLTAG
jgi:hypothetical protein